MGQLAGQLAEGLEGVLGVAVTAALSPLLRWRYARWGATGNEVLAAMPGDGIVESPKLAATRAVTVAAKPEAVWRWVVQMGHGRGGMYSYEALENLAGCDLHNATRIEPRWQTLFEGDLVRMGPEGYPVFQVRELVAGQSLVLQALDPQTYERTQATWTFLLKPVLVNGAPGTRLIARSRLSYGETLGEAITWRVLTDPIQFIMERKMLLGVKARAEGMATATETPREGATSDRRDRGTQIEDSSLWWRGAFLGRNPLG
jgi:hypothetical protein